MKRLSLSLVLRIGAFVGIHIVVLLVVLVLY